MKKKNRFFVKIKMTFNFRINTTTTTKYTILFAVFMSLLK